MSYITQRSRTFGSYLKPKECSSIVQKCRSEGRLKRFDSCTDLRAWNICDRVRCIYLLEYVTCQETSISGRTDDEDRRRVEREGVVTTAEQYAQYDLKGKPSGVREDVGADGRPIALESGRGAEPEDVVGKAGPRRSVQFDEEGREIPKERPIVADVTQVRGAPGEEALRGEAGRGVPGAVVSAEAGRGIPDAWRGVPDAGRGVPDAGVGVPDAGFGALGPEVGAEAGRGVPDAWRGVPDAGFGVPDAGFGLPDAGRGVPDAGAEAGRGIPEAVRGVPEAGRSVPEADGGVPGAGRGISGAGPGAEAVRGGPEGAPSTAGMRPGETAAVPGAGLGAAEEGPSLTGAGWGAAGGRPGEAGTGLGADFGAGPKAEPGVPLKILERKPEEAGTRAPGADESIEAGPSKEAKELAAVGPEKKPIPGAAVLGVPSERGLEAGKPQADVEGPEGKPAPEAKESSAIMGVGAKPGSAASIKTEEDKLKEAVVVGPDGKRIPGSSTILGADGKPVPVGADGRPIPGAAVLGADGKPLQRGSVILGSDGKPIPGSSLIIGADGKPVPVGSDGKPIPEAIIQGPDGKPIPRGSVVLGPDGKPIEKASIIRGADGKPVALDAEGKVIKGAAILEPDGKLAERGSVILGRDGKPIKDAVLKYGEGGKPIAIGADGKPIPGAVLEGPDGKPISKGPSAIGADGKSIPGSAVITGADGKPVVVGADGKPIPGAAVVGPDGKQLPKGSVILGPDGRVIPGSSIEIGADGKPIAVTADGKPIPGAIIEGPDGKPVKKGSVIIGPDGKTISGASIIRGADGKPIAVTSEGKLIPDASILGPEGKMLERGSSVILGADDKPIPGASLQYRPDGSPVAIGADGKPIPGAQILDQDGYPLTGKASVKGPDGRQIPGSSIEIGADGKPIAIGPDGGTITTAVIEGPDGKPVKSGSIVLGPDGKRISGASIIYKPDGTFEAIGTDGRPLEGSTIVSAEGVPLVGKASIKDASGKIIPSASLIMGADGRPVAVGADGKPLAEAIIEGPDGKVIERGSLLLDADGMPLKSASIVYGVDGQPVIVGADGQPIPGAIIQDGFGRPEVGEPSAYVPGEEGMIGVPTAKSIPSVLSAGLAITMSPPGSTAAECLCHTDPAIQIECLVSKLNETEACLREAVQKLESIHVVLDENDQLRMRLVTSELQLKTLKAQQEQFHKKVAGIPSELDRLEQALAGGGISAEEQISIYKQEIIQLKKCCIHVSECIDENQSLRAQLDALHDAESAHEELIICDNLTCIDDIPALQEIVQSLRATVKALLPIKEERDALNNEVQRLHARLRDLDVNYTGEVETLKRRSQILDNVMAENNRLCAQLDRYEGMDETIRMLIKRAQESEALRDKLEEANKCCARCECTMQDMQDERQNMSRTMEKIAGERDILMRKLEDCRSMEDELECLRCEAEDRERSRQHHIDCLQMECAAYRDKLNEMCERDQVMKAQLVHMQERTGDCVALKNRLRDAELAISDQEEEINRLLGKIQKLAGDQDRQCNIISELRLELNDQTELLCHCQEELQNMEALKEDMNSIKSDLEATIEKVADEKELLLNELQDTQTNLDSKTDEVNKVNRIMNQLRGDRRKSIEGIDTMEKCVTKLISYQTEIERLNDEIGRMRRAYAGLVSTAESNLERDDAIFDVTSDSEKKPLFDRLQDRSSDIKDREPAKYKMLFDELKGERKKSVEDADTAEKIVFKLIECQNENERLKVEIRRLKAEYLGIVGNRIDRDSDESSLAIGATGRMETTVSSSLEASTPSLANYKMTRVGADILSNETAGLGKLIDVRGESRSPTDTMQQLGTPIFHSQSVGFTEQIDPRTNIEAIPERRISFEQGFDMGVSRQIVAGAPQTERTFSSEIDDTARDPRFTSAMKKVDSDTPQSQSTIIPGIAGTETNLRLTSTTRTVDSSMPQSQSALASGISSTATDSRFTSGMKKVDSGTPQSQSVVASGISGVAIDPRFTSAMKKGDSDIPQSQPSVASGISGAATDPRFTSAKKKIDSDMPPSQSALASGISGAATDPRFTTAMQKVDSVMPQSQPAHDSKIPGAATDPRFTSAMKKVDSSLPQSQSLPPSGIAGTATVPRHVAGPAQYTSATVAPTVNIGSVGQGGTKDDAALIGGLVQQTDIRMPSSQGQITGVDIPIERGMIGGAHTGVSVPQSQVGGIVDPNLLGGMAEEISSKHKTEAGRQMVMSASIEQAGLSRNVGLGTAVKLSTTRPICDCELKRLRKEIAASKPICDCRFNKAYVTGLDDTEKKKISHSTSLSPTRPICDCELKRLRKEIAASKPICDCKFNKAYVTGLSGIDAGRSDDDDEMKPHEEVELDAPERISDTPVMPVASVGDRATIGDHVNVRASERYPQVRTAQNLSSPQQGLPVVSEIYEGETSGTKPQGEGAGQPGRPPKPLCTCAKKVCDCTAEHVKNMLEETSEAIVAVITEVKKIPASISKKKTSDEMDFIGGGEDVKPGEGKHECNRIKDLADRLKSQYETNKRLKEQLEILKRASEGDNSQQIINELLAQKKLLEDENANLRAQPLQGQAATQFQPDARTVGTQEQAKSVPDIAELMRQLEECHEKLKAQTAQLAEMRVQEHGPEVADLMEQLEECQAKLKNQISQSVQASSDLGVTDLMRQLEECRAQLQKQFARSDAQQQVSASTEVGDLMRQLEECRTQLQKQLSQLQAQPPPQDLTKELEECRLQLQKQLSQPTGPDIAAVMRQLDECRAELNKKIAEAGDAMRQLKDQNELERELNRLKKEFGDMKTEKDSLAAKLAQDQSAKVADLTRQLEQCRNELQNQLAKLGSQVQGQPSAEVDNLMRQLQECRNQLEKQLTQPQTELADLKRQLEECRNQLQKQLSQIQAQTQTQLPPGSDVDLKRQLDDCRDQLQKQAQLLQGQSPAEIKALSDVTDLKKQLEECKTQLQKQVSEQVADLMRQLEECRTQLQKQVSQLQQQVSGPTPKEVALETDIKNLKNDLESQKKNLAEKDDEIEKLKLSLKNCQSALDAKTGDASILQSEMDRLKSALKAAQDTADEKSRLAAGLQSDIDKIKQDLRSAQDLANEKSRQAESLQSDLDKCKQDVKAALESANQKGSEVSNLQSEIDKLKNALKAALDSAEEKGRLLADCQTELQKMKQDLETAQKQLTATQQELNAEKQNLLATQQELNTIKGELKTAKDMIDETKKQGSVLQGDLQAELTRLRAELASVQQQLSAKDQALKDQQAANQAECDKLRRELQDAKNATAAAYQRAASAESDLQAELDRLRQDNANLQSQLNTKNAELEALNRDKMALDDAINSLKQKSAQLESGLQGDLKSLKAENDALKEELRKLKETLAKQAIPVDNREQLEKERQEKENLQSIIDQLRGELDACNTKLLAVPAVPSGVSDQVKLLTAQLEKDHQRISELEKEIARLKKELAEAKSEKDKALSAKLVEAKGALAVEENASVDRMQEIMALTKKNNDLLTENEKLKKQIKRLEAENEDLRQKLKESTKKGIDKAAAAAVTSTTPDKDMDDIIKKYEEQIRKMDEECEKKLNALRNELKDKEKQFQSSMKSLKAQYERDVNNVKKDHKEGLSRMENVHDEIKKETEKNHAMEIDNLSMQRDILQDEVKRSKECICDLELANKELDNRLKKATTKRPTKDRGITALIDPKKKCTCPYAEPQMEMDKIGPSPSIELLMNKIIAGGLEALTFEELKVLHHRTCAAAASARGLKRRKSRKRSIGRRSRSKSKSPKKRSASQASSSRAPRSNQSSRPNSARRTPRGYPRSPRSTSPRGRSADSELPRVGPSAARKMLIRQQVTQEKLAELEVELKSEKAAITDMREIIQTEKSKNSNLREQIRARTCRCPSNPSDKEPADDDLDDIQRCKCALMSMRNVMGARPTKLKKKGRKRSMSPSCRCPAPTCFAPPCGQQGPCPGPKATTTQIYTAITLPRQPAVSETELDVEMKDTFISKAAVNVKRPS